jgi:hypothetical protein
VKTERYPKITPMRALALLIDLLRKFPDRNVSSYAVDHTIDALENHVKAGLVASKRRRAKRKAQP